MKSLGKQVLVLAGIIVLVVLILESRKIRVHYPRGANIYQKDFLYFVKVLEKTHPGYAEEPLPFALRDSWEAEVDRVYQSLSGDESLTDFYFKIAHFASRLDDGHTVIRFPGDSNLGYLPLEFMILQGKIYIAEVYSNEYRNLRYQRVTAFQDVPASEVLAIADAYTAADRANQGWRHRLLSSTALLLRTRAFYDYIMPRRDGPGLKLTVEMDDAQHSVELKFNYRGSSASLQSLINLTRSEVTRYLEGNHFQVLDDLQAVYLQLNRLPAEVDENLLNLMLQTLAERDCRTLIVDLRNNTGGSSRWSNVFLRHLIDEPTDVTIYRGWKRRGNRNRHSGDSIYTYQPLPPHFDGPVYVLTGSRTMSSATFLVVGVQDNGLGTVIGEASGNNQIRYGFTRHGVLPHTKLRFTSSVRIWERVKSEGRDLNTPITPDIPITATIDDVRENRDPVWEYLLSHLQEP